ncbi:MAG: DUF6503 family protein [Bacteroidota bacterium]
MNIINNMCWISLLVWVAGCSPTQETTSEAPADQEVNKGQALVMEMIAEVGTYEELSALKDVSYTYTYRTPDGKANVSQEKYLFEGELSWAAYDTRDLRLYPDQEGRLVQGFDGSTTWTTLGGENLVGEDDINRARFSRKTNFYWFAMMHKLADPGLTYAYKGTQEVKGITYDKVEVSFEEGVGDAQDIYLLFINPETKLVDQFLFTVKAYNRTDPLLMEVEYEEIDGLKLTTYRRYTPSNWEAEIEEETVQWVEEISENVQFNVGLTAEDFELAVEEG